MNIPLNLLLFRTNSLARAYLHFHVATFLSFHENFSKYLNGRLILSFGIFSSDYRLYIAQHYQGQSHPIRIVF